MTLVELLVVLAVLALVTGLMVAGLHTAASGWQHVTRHNADREQLESVNTLLRGMLSQIYPAKFESSSGKTVEFDGQNNHLDFLTPLPQRFGAQDIVPYSLRFSPDGSLHLSWQLDRRSAAGTAGFLPPSIDESIAGFQDGAFSYFGQINDSDPLRWWNSWQGQKKLPRLVKVRFTWQGETHELVVAPLANGTYCSASSIDAACLN